MSYKVEFSNVAMKGLAKVPNKQRLMILSWIDEDLNGFDTPISVH